MGKITPKSIFIFSFLILSFFDLKAKNFYEVKLSDPYYEGVCYVFQDRWQPRRTAFEESQIKKFFISEDNLHYKFAQPSINVGSNPSICRGTSIATLSYSNPTNNADQYSIDFNSTAESQGFSDVTKTSLPASPIQIQVPVNAQPAVYNASLYVYNPSDEQSVAYSITVTVKAIPSVNKPSDITACNQESVSTINFTGSNVSGTTYSWTNDNTSIGLGASGNNNISAFTAKNTGNSPISANITVTPKANGCDGTPQTFKITVNPTATVTKPSDITACNQESVSAISFTGSNVSGTSYSWTNDNTSIGLGASGNNNISAFTAKNTGNSPISANITVTPKANGCDGTPQTFKITVNPTATVTKPSDITACNQESVSAISFTGSNVSGTTYSWTNDNTSIGLGASGNNNISAFTAKNTGNSPISANITVTPKANGCDGTPQTFKITVNPTATVTKPSDITACNQESVSAISFTGSNVSGTTYSWTNDNTSIGLGASGNNNISAFTAKNTGNSPISANITVTPKANGCDGTPQTFKITVNPQATFTPPSDIEICAEEQISTITFSGNTVSNTTYTWTNNNTDIGLPSSGSGNIAGFKAKNTTSDILVSTITVTPTANGCSGTPETFTITVNPTPTITQPADIIACAGETIDQIKFPGASVSGTKKDWINDNTSIGLDESGRGNIDAFTAINNTTDIQVAHITLTPSANGCDGIPVNFTITVKPHPTVTAPEDQVYCNGTATDPIILSGTPSGIKYNITGGASVGLTNKTGVTEIPSFTALKGNATITIIPTADGCTGDPVTYNILVNPTPTVSISPANQQICSGGTTSLNLSGAVTGSSFNWTVAQISPSGSITGASDGSGNKIEQTLTNNTNSPATVKYTVTPIANGCTGTPISATVTVNPTPILEITIPECVEFVDLTDPTIKSGNTTSGLTYTYFTDAAASSSLSNPSNVGAGTYYIKGTTSSGCYVIAEANVIKLTPTVVNTEDAPSSICSGSNFDFTPVSSIDGTTISWTRAAVGNNAANQSDDKNIENPNETLVNTGTSKITATYNFTLETANGCSSTQEIKVDVLPEPQLIDNPIGEHCNGEEISHDLQSNLSNVSISWRRDAFLNNPAASGSGKIEEKLYNDSGNTIGVTYYITLQSNDGCTNEEQISFSLLSGPKVTATASATEICPGGSVNLSSTYEGQASLPSVLINENFNGSASNWTTTNNSTGGNNSKAAWTLRSDRYSPGYNYSIRSNDNSQFYFSNSDDQGNGTHTLTILKYKNPISTIGYSSLNLSFWQLYDHYGNSKGEVQISTDNSNWITIYNTPNTQIFMRMV